MYRMFVGSETIFVTDGSSVGVQNVVGREETISYVQFDFMDMTANMEKRLVG